MNCIIGHNIQEKIINDKYLESYAWMIVGNIGIGKFSLIKKFAETIISCSDDLYIISKEGIKIEDSHKIIEFLMHTSTNSRLKIVIIDNFETINYTAANALLKILEESCQNSLIFIISHNTNYILPTIKSRVRILNFYPLSNNQMKLIFGEKNKNLFDIVNGSPGLFYNILKNGGLIFYKEIIYSLQKSKIKNEFSDIIMYMISYIINKKIKIINNISVSEIFKGEIEEIVKIKGSIKELLELHKISTKLYDNSKNFNLDKNHIATAIANNFYINY